MTDELYAGYWRRRHSLNERNFYNYLLKEFNIQTEKYIESLIDKEPQNFHTTYFFSRIWITEILKEAYLKYGIKQNDFLNQIKTKDVSESDFLLAYSLFLADYFRRGENLFIVLGLLENYKDEIKQFVEQNSGLSKMALVTALTLFLRKINIHKSLVIARTEITKIMNYASTLWADLNPKVTKKQWIVILDGKERSTHGAMAGYPPIPLNEKFIVGGVEMDRPGDSSAPPQEVVNCRCALKFLN